MSYNVRSAMTMRANYCPHNPSHVKDLAKTITQTLSLSLPSNNLNQEYFWVDLRCSLIRQKGYLQCANRACQLDSLTTDTWLQELYSSNDAICGA